METLGNVPIASRLFVPLISVIAPTSCCTDTSHAQPLEGYQVPD